jgi:hypothetical protein
VPFLVPGIREVDAHFVQRSIGDLVAQHFHRVVVVQADVGGVVGIECVQQPAHSRCMHFDADVVARRILRGSEAQGIAIAETYLHHPRRGAAEHRIEIARCVAAFRRRAFDRPAFDRHVIQPEPRPQLFERTLLRRRESALAQHETAHGSVAGGDGVGLGRVGGGAGHRQPISPSTGDEALA